MNVAIVKTDQRMKHICRYLCPIFHTLSLDMNIDPSMINEIDVLVLPMNGLDNNGRFPDSFPINFNNEFWQMLRKETIIFYGTKHVFLEQLPQKKYYYLENEDVVKQNSILTAEGVLYLLMKHTNESLKDLNVDIIGYGNCGSEIYEMLTNLNVNCRVIRRAESKRTNFITIQEYLHTKSNKIIINTAPINCISNEYLKKNKQCKCMIDIASGNTIDLNYANELGIDAIKAGNLPVTIAPKSAGKILADFIKGVLLC